MNITSLLIFQNLHLPEYQQKVAECASDVMSRYSEVQSSIVYENIGLLVDNILKNEMPNTTRIINMQIPLNYARNELEPYYMLTIILQSLDELEKYFNAIYRILGWNSRSKHFIIYLGTDSLNKLFEITWRKYIIRLVVIDRYSNLYTYDPLREDKCGTEIKKKFICSCKNLDFDLIDKIYNTIGFRKFKGCEIKILTSPLVPYVIDPNKEANPGFEIVAIREMSKILNFTIKYVKHNHSYWGYKTESSNYTDMYQTFFRRKADVMLGMVVANGSFLYDFDSSIAHTKSDLTFYIPSPKRVHPWENIIKVYHIVIWSIMLVVAIFFAIIWNIVGRFKENSENFDSTIHTISYIWGITVCESMKQPLTLPFRFLFIIWTFYCLVLTSTFESSLMSFLTKPAYEANIDNVNELSLSSLKVGGYAYAKELFSKSGGNTNEEYQTIYNNWIDCDINERCVNETASNRDMASLYDVRQVNYLTPYYYVNKDGSQKLYQMPIISSFYMWILFLKGFPLRTSINTMIQRFTEFGLLEKWIRDVSYTAPKPQSTNHVPLSFEHIVFAVVVLCIGNALAIIVFIGEQIYGNIVLPLKQKRN